MGSQHVKLRYVVIDNRGNEVTGWYDGAADKAHAMRVPVPGSGSSTVNITVR